MTVKVKKANLRRLASLSALGAGALGVAAGTADAGTPDADGIVYSGIIDEKVGWVAGYGAMATIVGPNSAAGVLRKGTWYFGTGWANLVALSARLGPHGTGFRFLAYNSCVCYPATFALAFPRKARFGSPTGTQSRSRGQIGLSGVGGTRSFKDTHFSATDRYLLFRFTGGKLPHPVYGWAQIGVSLPGYDRGPNVTLLNYAYDITGAQIPAGYRGKALDGEEGAFAGPPEQTGLPALALGAVGLRSWRAARQAEAASAAGATQAH
jgi:hypothetical protein